MVRWVSSSWWFYGFLFLKCRLYWCQKSKGTSVIWHWFDGLCWQMNKIQTANGAWINKCDDTCELWVWYSSNLCWVELEKITIRHEEICQKARLYMQPSSFPRPRLALPTLLPPPSKLILMRHITRCHASRLYENFCHFGPKSTYHYFPKDGEWRWQKLQGKGPPIKDKRGPCV